MKFAEFAQALKQLEETPSRLEMTELLAQLYQKFDQEEVVVATYLMQGRLVPEYKSLEFHLSTKMIQRTLTRLLEQHQQATIAASAAIQTNLFGEEDSTQFEALVIKKFKSLGDLGLVAEEVIEELNLAPTNGRSILQVFELLTKIAQDEGSGSQERKVQSLLELLEGVDGLSARYVTRIVMGKLRLGFSTMTIIDALSWAKTGDKSERDLLEEAYHKRADVGQLAQTYLFTTSDSDRQEALASYQVVNGVPVVPALAQRLNTAQEVIEKMGEVLVEPKYDGLRVQIHLHQGQPPVAYTRNLEDISHMLPELDEALAAFKCESCILDSEAIGYDPLTDELLPFQRTVTRKRKHDVAEQAAEIPLRFYVFDIMELDGQPLIDLPLVERKQKLAAVFEETETFYQTPYIRTHQAAEVKAYHHQQLELGLEGALMKQVNETYRGGRKGWRWVKMKEEEGTKGKLSDTVDVIVMGYYAGKGKRSQFGIGAILVGVVDEQERDIKTITKIGTGLSDDQFREMKQRCDEAAVKQKPAPYVVDKDLFPDVWVAPAIVIEVAADEITKSPKHSAGVALRFPRLIKFRDDKHWEQATTVAELQQI